MVEERMFALVEKKAMLNDLRLVFPVRIPLPSEGGG